MVVLPPAQEMEEVVAQAKKVEMVRALRQMEHLHVKVELEYQATLLEQRLITAVAAGHPAMQEMHPVLVVQVDPAEVELVQMHRAAQLLPMVPPILVVAVVVLQEQLKLVQ